MTRCSAENSSMRAVTNIDAAVFSGVGACLIAQRLIQFNMLTSVKTDEPASGNRNRPRACPDAQWPPSHFTPWLVSFRRLPRFGGNRPGMRVRGLSILETLVGLRDGVLQTFTQKPQSATRDTMTVAQCAASAQDSPMPARRRARGVRRTVPRRLHAHASPRLFARAVLNRRLPRQGSARSVSFVCRCASAWPASPSSADAAAPFRRARHPLRRPSRRTL